MPIDLHVPLDTLVAAPFEAYGVQGWLVLQPDHSVDAFWARSPHLGCYVELFQQGDGRFERVSGVPPGQRGLFHDVCYGSNFLLSGERFFGPSPRGLDRFEVLATPAPDVVVVDLARVRLGDCGTPPGPAVPCSRPGNPTWVAGPPLYDWRPQ